MGNELPTLRGTPHCWLSSNRVKLERRSSAFTLKALSEKAQTELTLLD